VAEGSDVLKTSGWLVIEAKKSYHWRSQPDTLRIVKYLKNRPAELKRDQMAVQVNLAVPASAFTPTLTAEVQF